MIHVSWQNIIIIIIIKSFRKSQDVVWSEGRQKAAHSFNETKYINVKCSATCWMLNHFVCISKMWRFSTFALLNPYDIQCACYTMFSMTSAFSRCSLYKNIWNTHRLDIIGYASLQSAFPIPMCQKWFHSKFTLRVTKTATDIDWIHYICAFDVELMEELIGGRGDGSFRKQIPSSSPNYNTCSCTVAQLMEK